jgi:multicomponent Na+:H+ antiporter subunit D
VEAGLAEHRHLVVGVSLLVSALTLFSMTKIWAGAFWGSVEPDPGGGPAAARLPVPALMVAPTAALVVMSLAIAGAAGPVHDLSVRAAEALLAPEAYAALVVGR